MRSPAKRLVALVSILAMLASTLPASADEATARVRFKKGIELYDKKQYQEALAEFEAAYKEKPSAGIKQNIALSLKGLSRYAEAATALDEALEEGRDTLKPETKQAMDRELADLSKIVATVVITIAGGDDKKSAETVITIQPANQPQPRVLAPGQQRRPIRVMPGMYTFSAKIPGLPTQPEPKKLALISGAPTEISFGVDPANQGQSSLHIHANVAEASIKIDGVEVGKGSWQGPVPANKKMRVEITAAGYRPLTFDMTVPVSSAVDSPVTLQPTGAAPSEYKGGTNTGTGGTGTTPEKPRGRAYLALSGSLEATSYRVSQAGGIPISSFRQAYPGVSLGGRVGYLFTPNLAIEGFVEAGVAGSEYDPPAALGGPSVRTTVTHWMLLPALRFQTRGKVRFTAGTGIGVHGLSLKAEQTKNQTSNAAVESSGIAFAWLLDAGVQFDVGPLFIETAAFTNLHGVGPVEEDTTDRRALLGSPAVRAGLRVGLGIPF